MCFAVMTTFKDRFASNHDYKVFILITTSSVYLLIHVTLHRVVSVVRKSHYNYGQIRRVLSLLVLTGERGSSFC